MSINDETILKSTINAALGEYLIEAIKNQQVKEKIHITNNKTEILKALLVCFRKGGINGIKEGSLHELATIIDSIFSFDFQGNKGSKTTKKESILRMLQLCEQKLKERKG